MVDTKNPVGVVGAKASPTSTTKHMPASAPIPAKPLAALPKDDSLVVKCTGVENVEQQVTLVDDNDEKGNLQPHDCMRMVYSATFVQKRHPESHPQVHVVVRTLVPGKFEVGKEYLLSLKAV